MRARAYIGSFPHSNNSFFEHFFCTNIYIMKADYGGFDFPSKFTALLE